MHRKTRIHNYNDRNLRDKQIKQTDDDDDDNNDDEYIDAHID